MGGAGRPNFLDGYMQCRPVREQAGVDPVRTGDCAAISEPYARQRVPGCDGLRADPEILRWSWWNGRWYRVFSCLTLALPRDCSCTLVKRYQPCHTLWRAARRYSGPQC